MPLRTDLIRLAYHKPELRDIVLPLLKKAEALTSETLLATNSSRWSWDFASGSAYLGIHVDSVGNLRLSISTSSTGPHDEPGPTRSESQSLNAGTLAKPAFGVIRKAMAKHNVGRGAKFGRAFSKNWEKAFGDKKAAPLSMILSEYAMGQEPETSSDAVRMFAAALLIENVLTRSGRTVLRDDAGTYQNLVREVLKLHKRLERDLTEGEVARAARLMKAVYKSGKSLPILFSQLFGATHVLYWVGESQRALTEPVREAVRALWGAVGEGKIKQNKHRQVKQDKFSISRFLRSQDV